MVNILNIVVEYREEGKEYGANPLSEKSVFYNLQDFLEWLTENTRITKAEITYKYGSPNPEKTDG